MLLLNYSYHFIISQHLYPLNVKIQKIKPNNICTPRVSALTNDTQLCLGLQRVITFVICSSADIWLFMKLSKCWSHWRRANVPHNNLLITKEDLVLCVWTSLSLTFSSNWRPTAPDVKPCVTWKVLLRCSECENEWKMQHFIVLLSRKIWDCIHGLVFLHCFFFSSTPSHYLITSHT